MKNFKKMVAIFFSLAMILAFMSTMAFAEKPTDTSGDFYVDSTNENLYHIANLEGLKAFRDSVNSGDNYSGKTVQLDANITMDSTSWVPIGSGNNLFEGTFDGKDKTITGLTINDATLDEAGLFSKTGYGSTVKDLKIASPTINGRCTVGALAGDLWASTVNNVDVTGTIVITGYHVVGGLAGQSSYTSITNCDVTGSNKAKSIITGNYGANIEDGDNIGGLIGMYGPSDPAAGKTDQASANCSVSNLTLKGWRKVGGLYGQSYNRESTYDASVNNIDVICIADNSFATNKTETMGFGGMVGIFAVLSDDTKYRHAENSQLTGTVSNVTITCSGDDAAAVNNVVKMGIISGGQRGSTNFVDPTDTHFAVTVSGSNSTSSPKVSENKTSIYSAYTAPVTNVAKIGDVEYATLKAAIAAANASTDHVAIEVLADCEVGSEYSINNPLVLTKDNAVLDLKGKTVTVNNNFSFVMQGDGIEVKNGTLKSAVNNAKTTKINSYILVINDCDDVKLTELTTVGGVSIGGSQSDWGTTSDPKNENLHGAGKAKNVTFTNCDITSGDFYAVCSQMNSTATIVSGKYTANTANGWTGSRVIHGDFTGTDGPQGYITVTGGSFNGGINSSNAGWVVLKGGVYTASPNAGLLASGYVVVDNSDTTYRFKVQKSAVAEINGTSYATLEEAIAAVPTDGTETTITMIGDEAVEAGVTIAAGNNIVLELNGKTISGNTDSATTYALITNKGTLTIQDSTDTKKDGTGNGLITTNITNPDQGDVPGYASNTITNLGTLTVKSGKLVNNGSGYACYAIDNQTNGTLYTPVLNIEGGRMKQMNAYRYAVRMFCNSTTNVNTANISGGVITGGYGLWLQLPNDKDNKAKLNITDGMIMARDGAALYIAGKRGPRSNVNVAISGGTITGNGAMIQGIDSGSFGSLSISGGKFKNIQCGSNIENFITGGYYGAILNDIYIAEGYEKVDNLDPETMNDYRYVVQKAAVAQNTVTGKKYDNLQSALNEATTDETVQLLRNITINGSIRVNGTSSAPVSKKVTLDLNGFNITSAGMWLAGGGLNIKGQGTITSSDAGTAPVSIYYSDDQESKRTLTIGKDVTLVGQEYGVNIFGTNNDAYANNIETTINGTVKGTIFVLGNLTNEGNAILVNVGSTAKIDTSEISKDTDGSFYNGISANGYATVTISDGAVVKGGTAVEVRAGSLTVNGGEFTALDSEYKNFANGSGSSSQGAAIAVVQHTTAKKIVAKINGGTFTGPCALGIANPQTNVDKNVSVSVSGGIFKGAVNQTVKNEDNRISEFITGGTYSDDSVKGALGELKYVANGYEAVKLTAANIAASGLDSSYIGWYQVGKVTSGTVTKTAESSAQVTYQTPRTVVNEDYPDAALETGSTVTVNVTAPTNATDVQTENIAGNNSLALYDNSQLEAVVGDALAEVDAGTSEVNVEIVIVKDNVREEETSGSVTKVTYDVHPEAIIYVSNKKVGSVDLEEVELATGMSFTIKLPTTQFTDEQKIQVTHIHSDQTEEALGQYIVDNIAGKGYIEITGIKDFSDFELAVVDEQTTTGSFNARMTLSLNESIDVNMYIYNLKEGTTASKYTVTSTINGREVLKNVPLTNKHSEKIERTDAYRLVVADCAAKEVGDTITISVKYNDSLVRTITYSVQRYCENACKAGNASDGLKALCRSVLDYGTAAQMNFAHNVNNPANANYSDWDTVMALKIPSSVNVKDSTVTGTNPFDSTKVTLSLESRVEMNFYFQPKGNILDYTFTVKRGDAAAEPVKYSSLRYKDGYYVLTVAGIAATDLDETLVVTGSKGDDSKAITYSPLSYAYSNQNVSGYETLGNVLRAMYWYNQKAEEYFGQL